MTVRPFLRSPDRYARVLCGCQPVGSPISAIVAPFARPSSLSTVVDLLGWFGEAGTAGGTVGRSGAGSPAAEVSEVPVKVAALRFRNGGPLGNSVVDLIFVVMIGAPAGNRISAVSHDPKPGEATSLGGQIRCLCAATRSTTHALRANEVQSEAGFASMGRGGKYDGMTMDQLFEQARGVAALLTIRRATIAVAESSSGGLISEPVSNLMRNELIGG